MSDENHLEDELSQEEKYNHAFLEDILKAGRKAAFYARYSTDHQDYLMQQHSVQNLLQQFDCELYDEEYIDKAVSALKVPLMEREHMKRLIDDASAGKFDFIVVYKNDRIARRTEDHSEFRKLMRELNMHVVISSSRELYTVGEIVPLTVRDGLTRIESALIEERTRDAFKSKIKHGKWIGGEAPYGYKYFVKEEKGKGKGTREECFEDVKNEQDVVKEIFRMFQLGYSFQKIATEIDSRKLDLSKNWRKEKIKYIITNPFYAGFMSMNRYENGKLNDRSQWVLGKVSNIKPLFSWEEWEYCMGLYEEKTKKHHHPKKYNTPFLLRDILYCEHCRNPLRTKNQITRSIKTKEEYGSRIYECRSEGCNFKLDADVVHHVFKEKILPGILEYKMENKQTILEQRMQQRLEEEKSIVEQRNNDVKKEILKYKQGIDQLDTEIKTQYGKMEINEEEINFIQMMMSHRSKKYDKVNQMKQEAEMLAKRLVEIEMLLNKKTKHPLVELLPKLTDSNMDDQLLRMFIVQFFDSLFIDRTGKLSLTIHDSFTI